MSTTVAPSASSLAFALSASAFDATATVPRHLERRDEAPSTWHSRLQALGACDAALKYASKFPDTIAGARAAWENCKVVEVDPQTGVKKDVAATWMTWLCMRTIDQYGVMEADNFRVINSAETVLLGLVERTPT